MEINGNNEPKIRLNIKQNTKGEKYYDITVRGDTLEDIKAEFASVEAYAFSMGCKHEVI